MAYTKQTWSDLPSKTTPINAERLTHIEDGIYNAADKADSAYSGLSNKVDKVTGKGLSTNDYDNASKAIVDGVTAQLAAKADASDVSAITDGTTIDSFSDVETALEEESDIVTKIINSFSTYMEEDGKPPHQPYSKGNTFYIKDEYNYYFAIATKSITASNTLSSGVNYTGYVLSEALKNLLYTNYVNSVNQANTDSRSYVDNIVSNLQSDLNLSIVDGKICVTYQYNGMVV